MICSPHNPAQPATAGFFTPKISRRALVSTAVLGLLAGCGGGGGEAPAAHAGAPATTVEIYGDQEPWVVHAAALNAITLSVAHDLGLQHAGWGEDYRGPEDLIDSVHRSQAASDRLAVLLVAAIDRSNR
ncbi:hypothetical protein [Acidovorax sp. NCPPB 3576]|uniref:hypothetical protein n=1 Tax=Acidovorax sp. NCPPB 3576 TaxID=2940488 RepID=UPI00234BDB0C|nr:hypothetical protein [Acidovorax sp. NCPPB 3576]WCM86640.1 hypothetical protein M5C98_14765 [Acidovorax sp. NCPPB 3576]